MRVFVSATSIVSGGALNILKQFIINAKPSIEFVIAVNSKVELESKYTEQENISFIRIVENSRLDRVQWDFWRAKQEITKLKCRINLVISLQNTTLNVGNIPQVVYVHQGIFLHDQPWNPLIASERKYAFYKYVYPRFIFAFSRASTQYVVQTEWMRKALMQKYNVPQENVFNIKPDIVYWDEKNKDYSSECIEDKTLLLFYPATGELFKNHLLVLNAIRYLHNSTKKLNKMLNLRVIFTLNVSSESNVHIHNYLNENPNIKKYCEFTGPISYEQVKSFYDSCHAVTFPSSIESFGLPLLEAAMLGKKILSLNTSFAREVLDGYEGVEFIEHNSKMWANSISGLSNNGRFHTARFVPKYKTSWHDFFELITKNEYV
ncbi:glycosyltransferase [Providencia huaxiensis]|uniref:glycosyltransferase n=1 Tax=Providencia huaxiensis TaxID=2027290 RepID=UPI0034E3A065